MTPQNEAWIREVVALGGTGTAVKIARLCLAEIDSLRNRTAPAEVQAPKPAPEIRVSADYIGIPKERLAFLEMRDRRCTEWDRWAADEIYGDGSTPMPKRPRRSRAGAAVDQVSLTNQATGVPE